MLVVNELVDKKKQLQARLDGIIKESEQLRRGIESLNLSIKLFDPSYQIKDPEIQSKQKNTTRAHYFKSNEAKDYIIEFLGQSEHPQSTTNITKFLMEKKCLNKNDAELQGRLQKSILQSIRSLESTGLLISTSFNHRDGYEWILNKLMPEFSNDVPF